MVDEKDVAAPPKKKSVAELLAETAQLLAALSGRQDALEARVEELAGQTEAHRMMLQREEQIEPGKVGLEKSDYPGLFHRSVEEGASSWARITPRVDYCTPGITIQGFTVPFHAGVPLWVPTPFMTEALGREIV